MFANDGWEDVGSGGWEDVGQVPKGVVGGEATDALGDDLLRRGRAAVGGLEAGVSMLTKLPGMALGGLAGLAAGSDADVVHKVMNMPGLRGYDPQTEFGQVAMEALGAAREKSGDFGGDSPGLRTLNELAFDVGTMALPLGPKGPRPMSPQARAYMEGLQAIEARRKADASKPPAEPIPQAEPGTQLNLDLRQDSPLLEHPSRQPTPVADMWINVGERMDNLAKDSVARNAEAGQPDLFNPTPRALRDEMLAPTEALRRERESIPFELSLTDEPLPVQNKLEPFRKEDVDFQMPIEQLEQDPYFQTLKAEFDKWNAKRDQLNKMGEKALKNDAHDRAKKAFDKANENLVKANEVYKEAETYYKKRLTELGIKNPDGYVGSMWADKPKKGTIEKTPVYRTGTKGRRQGGSVYLEFGDPRVPQRVKDLRDELSILDKRVRGIEDARENATPELRDKMEKRLEQLYYQQMRAWNEIDRLTNPDNKFNKLGGTGTKGRRQGGTIDLSGIDFGGYPNLPDTLKDWIFHLAKERALDKLEESGVSPAELVRGKVSPEANAEYLTYVKEALNNPTFIKQAISNSGGFAFPKRDFLQTIGEPGKIGRQEGAIKWERDPEFLKFRDKLPENLRPQAKKMWKELNKQPASPEVTVNERAMDVVDGVPGLKYWKDEIGLITKSPEELKPSILQENDLGGDWMAKAGRQLMAGGKLLAFGTQNTLARFTVQTMDRALREAGKSIDSLILNKNTGFKPKWEKLTEGELAQTWSVLASAEGKETLSRDRLFEAGLNEKQVDAAETLQKALERTFEKLNEARVAIGKKPIEGRIGYLPSRFRGDWTVHVKDAEGNLVHILGANTKWGANAVKHRMQQAHPELKFEDVQHEPLHRFKDASDITAGYQSLLEILADQDPRVQALESTYADYLKKQAYETLSTRRHFWEKKGVGGAEGFKEWQDAKLNAEEGLRSIMNYMDHAMKWVEVNKSMKDMRTLLRDEEIQRAQPNAQQWAQGYVDQALGRSTELARSLDKIFDVVSENTGIGQSLMLKGVRDLKHYMTAMYLGFLNAGFSISQMVQVLQTVPAWMLMLKNKGAEASIAHAYFAGSIDATKGYALGRENMTPIGKKAWEYAKEYGIVEPKLLEDVKAITDKTTNKWVERLMTGNMTYFEKLARTTAYMSWVHFLDSTKKFSSSRELFEVAANLTDMTMVDYRGHERAQIYKQLGIIGESANALTTFKHNQYSQLWALSKHRKTGGLSPAAAHLSLMALFGGLMGLPGREEIDGIIQAINKFSSERIPTTREAILKAPDLMGFGGISYLSGMDFSSKFSAANILPDNPLTALFPFAGTVGNVLEAGGKLAMNPSVPNAMRFGNSVTPNSAKWIFEKYFSQGDMTLNPDNLEGKVRRDGKGNVARGFALRSMEESKDAHTLRNVKEADKFFEDKRASIIGQAKDALFQGNLEEVRRLAQKYETREGDIETFVNELVGNAESQRRTELERILMRSVEGSNPRRMKRIRDMIR